VAYTGSPPARTPPARDCFDHAALGYPSTSLSSQTLAAVAARTEAAADRHRVASTATRLPRGYYEATTRATTRLLRGYYAATTWLLRGHYQATTRLLRGYHETTTRSRPRATRPAAQQRQHRSPAGAAHASNSEPTPTIRHTKGNISRRPFSTCRTSWTTLKTKHACDLLVQQDAAGVQPSLHSDLADEDEHVKRAGLGQVEHDGAVHDRQAPTPASSNHVACAGQHPVAP
jgi:hypothetical protein